MRRDKHFRHSSYFPTPQKLCTARRDGFPTYNIGDYFYASLGLFQVKLQYKDNDYQVSWRGFLNGIYRSSWQVVQSTPYQTLAIGTFHSIIVDYLDPTPFNYDEYTSEETLI